MSDSPSEGDGGNPEPEGQSGGGGSKPDPAGQSTRGSTVAPPARSTDSTGTGMSSDTKLIISMVIAVIVATGVVAAVVLGTVLSSQILHNGTQVRDLATRIDDHRDVHASIHTAIEVLRGELAARGDAGLVDEMRRDQAGPPASARPHAQHRERVVGGRSEDQRTAPRQRGSTISGRAAAEHPERVGRAESEPADPARRGRPERIA